MTGTDHTDIDTAYAALAETEPRFAALIARVGIPDPFDFPGGGRAAGSDFAGMVMHIPAQQISARVALLLYDRHVATTGGTPTPDSVLSLNVDQLRAIGTSHSKAIYLRALAEAVGSGRRDIEHLTNYNDAEATLIKGIGVWSAEMFLMHQLRRADVLPAGDLAIRAAIRNLCALPEIPSIEETRRIGEAWKPYRTYASALLWRSLAEAPAVVLADRVTSYRQTSRRTI